MSKALRVVVFIFLIQLIVPNCHGAKDSKKNRIIATVFTPYDDSGGLNLDIVPQQAEFFAKRNVKIVQILGFYGEGPSITLEQRKALIKKWDEQINRLGLILVVEIGAMPFPDQLELARFCSQLNVSAISAFPLLVYEAKTKEEIIEDYQLLSDAAPNIPLLHRGLTVTGPEITSDEAFVTLIGKVKTFVGGVMSINDVLNVKAAIPSTKNYEFLIYGSRSIATALALNLRSVSNAVNLCPTLVLAMEAAVDAGNIDEALDMQQQLNRLFQAIVSNNGDIMDYNSRSYIKHLRAAYQIFRGIDLGARLPFEKANSTELETIRSNLEEYEDFINCYCK